MACTIAGNGPRWAMMTRPSLSSRMAAMFLSGSLPIAVGAPNVRSGIGAWLSRGSHGKNEQADHFIVFLVRDGDLFDESIVAGRAAQ